MTIPQTHIDLEKLWFILSRSPRKALARAVPDDGIVIDVGSGDMSKSYAFVHRVKPSLSVVGVEKFEHATIYGVSVVPGRFTETGKITRVACDFTVSPLPFAENSLNGAFCSHVIEHVDDRQALIDQIFRVVCPGGSFYIETPGPRSLLIGPNSWMRRLAPQAPINYYDDPTHLAAPLTLTDLQGLLRGAGFAIERSGYHRDFGRLGMPLYAMLVALGALPFLPRSLRARFIGAGWWNLVGWPIYALAVKPVTQG